jgi:ADP-ribose pyrophosphatase YjhB (NUDIX family)
MIRPPLKTPILIVDGFIKKNKRYLAIKRAKNVEVGTWETPGGKVRLNEKVEHALKREIKEELGINIKINKFLGWGEGLDCPTEYGFKIHRFVLYFDCGIISEDLKPESNEILEHKWVTLEEFKKLKPLSKPIEDFFKKFG